VTESLLGDYIYKHTHTEVEMRDSTELPTTHPRNHDVDSRILFPLSSTTCVTSVSLPLPPQNRR